MSDTAQAVAPAAALPDPLLELATVLSTSTVTALRRDLTVLQVVIETAIKATRHTDRYTDGQIIGGVRTIIDAYTRLKTR